MHLKQEYANISTMSALDTSFKYGYILPKRAFLESQLLLDL